MSNDIGISASQLKAIGQSSPQLQNSSHVEKHRSNQLESTTLTSRQLRAEDIVARNDLDSDVNKINKNEGLDMSGVRFTRHTNMATPEEITAFMGKRNKHGATSVHLEILEHKMNSKAKDLQKELESAVPSLKGREYGISVDNKGELTLIGGNASKSYNKILNELNGANEVKSLANQFVSVLSDWNDIDKKLDGQGLNIDGIEVTRDNFSSVIDISSTLQDKTIPAGSFHYLIDKYDGKVGYKDQSNVDEYINGEWVRVKTKGEWLNTEV